MTKAITTNEIANNNTSGKERSRFLKGLDILSYALTAFLALGCEGILAYGIEQKIYGKTLKEFSTAQSILHWVLTYIVWIAFAVYILRSTKKKGYDLFPKTTKKITKFQWACIIVGVAACLISTWIDWNGSKVLAEFARRGALKFVFQYIYYLIEVFLVMLIIIGGQKACEIWFKKENIPYGGIIAAVTWGLGHILTKGTIAAGIATALCGLALGSVYLLTNRKPRLSYALLCVMFIL